MALAASCMEVIITSMLVSPISSALFARSIVVAATVGRLLVRAAARVGESGLPLVEVCVQATR